MTGLGELALVGFLIYAAVELDDDRRRAMRELEDAIRKQEIENDRRRAWAALYLTGRG